MAILKALNMMKDNPIADIGIAHPATEELQNLIRPIIPYLKRLGVKHYWVTEDGKIDIV